MAAFPDKPINIVIGFPAGGPLDQHARLLTDKPQAVLGSGDFARFLATETPRWEKAVKASGARMD